MSRRMVLLTWGHSNPHTGKTASGLLRYCPDECIAVYDPDNVGRTAQELLEAGGTTPVIGSLDDVSNPKTLVMGIAPPGGKIPVAWRAVILDAISRGMDVLSGLHDFLSNDAELMAAAKARGVTITDVRKNTFHDIARRQGLNSTCCRLHTVGHDCSIGKMLASLEIARGLAARGRDAHFVATGQTGIMVSGAGLPIDCVVADFVSGAAEQLVLDTQHHDIILVEGQGSLVHPSYAAVTLGILHGCQPHGLIFVFEAGREVVGGLEHVPLPSLARQRELFETMASIYQPCQTIGLAMNGRKLSPPAAAELARRVEDELELPVVDIVRDGPDRLLDTAEAFYDSRVWQS
ncbi:DUF1611 domain-containing protein [Aureliella helgolandensis]|uniref:DUF1611 domain-containing protein n=1 Tax=Aureliella helgolandensis TaxID=2527968 RepID=A0A518FZI7_9BACT|nr:DUF1611 domain-containing protein [Aureliella helgolandensis]QDV21763.1 hypothetical protein Q31a_00420 [Aureliella helgolandensis]